MARHALIHADTLGEVVVRAAEEDADRVFLESGGELITTGRIEDMSARVAGALQSFGVEQDDRAAIMMHNVPEFVEAWFALARKGIIEVPVHAAYKGPLLEHVLSESGARVLFIDEQFVERLAGLDLPALELLVVLGDVEAVSGLPWPAVPMEEMRGHNRSVDASLGRRAPSCILYTSGTTGLSKGVVLSHNANLHLARTVIDFMEYESEDVLYTSFPLFHVNAKFTSVMTALMCGGRLILDDRFSASAFWDRIRAKGVTAFNYMGSMLTILHKQSEHPNDAQNPVRRCYGAACPASIWEDFERRFDLQLREHYGMTEIGIATMNTAKVRRVGSIGQAAPYFDMRIADDDDNELPDGEVGEIQVRPRLPNVILTEYWNRPEATIDAFRNLWFHTGDQGRRDVKGFFFFVDRLKDCIRRRGENISSFEVESVVNMHPGVLESAAFGIPSELGEDELAVAVVLKPGARLSATELLDFCQPRLPHFAVPRYVMFRQSLPKTPSQRIQKFKLREEGFGKDGFDRVAAGYDIVR